MQQTCLVIVTLVTDSKSIAIRAKPPSIYGLVPPSHNPPRTPLAVTSKKQIIAANSICQMEALVQEVHFVLLSVIPNLAMFRQMLFFVAGAWSAICQPASFHSIALKVFRNRHNDGLFIVISVNRSYYYGWA